MDIIGQVLRGIIGIVLAMVVVYLLFATNVHEYALQLFAIPVGVAMVPANPPTRKALGALGLTGMVIILIAGGSNIVWPLLLTIPPIVGYIVSTKAFEEWEGTDK